MPLSILQVEHPLLLARVHRSVESDDVHRFHALVDEAFIDPHRPALFVFDLLEVKRFDAEARQALGTYRRGQKAAIGELELGIVVMVRSGFIRGAVAAVQWVSTAFRNHRVVVNSEGARTTVAELCDLHRLELSRDARSALNGFLDAPDRAAG